MLSLLGKSRVDVLKFLNDIETRWPNIGTLFMKVVSLETTASFKGDHVD